MERQCHADRGADRQSRLGELHRHHQVSGVFGGCRGLIDPRRGRY